MGETKSAAGKVARGFFKQKYLTSDKYKEQRDLISALLEDDKRYTKAEVKKLIDDYLIKEVK